MFDLAQHYGDGPISLGTIAERQNISLNYLEQLIAPLRKSGLVKSVRGAQGGYMLTDAPQAISIGRVLTILEGPLSPSECILEDDNCSNADLCVTRVVYKKIKASIDDVVENITLQDMLDEQTELVQIKS